MGTKQAVRRQQRGAVAIVMSLFLVVVVGVLALVVDLGHLYVTKTELQNAADAAALAGAAELDGSAAGVTRAMTRAVAVARENAYDFSVPVASSAGDGGLILQVGTTPDAMVDAAGADTDAEAADKLYFRVATGNRNVGAWFAAGLGLYGGAATSYPELSPYAQTGGAFFQAPSSGHRGRAGRRMLTVAILNCSAIAGGSCRPAQVLGYGKFFLQRPANTPSDKNITWSLLG